MTGTVSEETRMRDEIVAVGRSLFERGLTPGSSGNISLRLPDGGWLVTATNASLGFLDPAIGTDEPNDHRCPRAARSIACNARTKSSSCV